MTEQNFPKYRQRLNLLMKRLSNDLAGPVSGFAQCDTILAEFVENFLLHSGRQC